VDDDEFAVRLLRATGMHEGRHGERLLSWARAAAAYGAALPARPGASRVVESDGGLQQGLLARYSTRPPTVELYTDALERAERLIDELGWRDWFPRGCVREAALVHESVHEQLHHGAGRAALRRALGHRLLSLGPRTLYGHVAGAEEIAAHAHAQAVCGLGRSPLLLGAALAATAEAPDPVSDVPSDLMSSKALGSGPGSSGTSAPALTPPSTPAPTPRRKK
jgi:hypothetical protein